MATRKNQQKLNRKREKIKYTKFKGATECQEYTGAPG